LRASGHAGSPGLHRGLGRFDVVALCVNSIVGAGVFAMPAGLAIDSGRYSLAVIFVAFVVVGFLALSLAEVSSRYDVTGGPQVYAQRTFGPATGFTVGWLFSVSRLASYALIAQVMLDYAAAVWPSLAAPWPRAVAITVFTVFLAVINVRGVTRGAWVGNLLTIAKMLPLGLIALAGLWFAGWNDIPATEPRQPGGLSSALQLALFACVGFDVAAIVAGEMRDPRRDLPVSILGGLAISCLLYLLLMLACFGVLPNTAASALPLADVAASFVGPAGATLMSLTAVVSCAGGLAVQMLVSRSAKPGTCRARSSPCTEPSARHMSPSSRTRRSPGCSRSPARSSTCSPSSSSPACLPTAPLLRRSLCCATAKDRPPYPCAAGSSSRCLP
jgi:basic amino acid/polyamine antiporter, APA family